jgi:hypothetical protein
MKASEAKKITLKAKPIKTIEPIKKSKKKVWTDTIGDSDRVEIAFIIRLNKVRKLIIQAAKEGRNNILIERNDKFLIEKLAEKKFISTLKNDGYKVKKLSDLCYWWEISW